MMSISARAKRMLLLRRRLRTALPGPFRSRGSRSAPPCPVAVALAILALPVAAADNSQLLAEFRKIDPGISQFHVIAETPLVVAITGRHGAAETPSVWGRDELLGVFARRGEQFVTVSILPNNDFPAALWIASQAPDSITFGLADPDYGIRSDNLKIFFDPNNYFPRRMARFAPVRVRRIAAPGGVVSLTGTDGKQDFTARERNGAWHVTTTPAVALPPAQPVVGDLQVPPMPVSTIGQFEQARPAKAKQVPAVTEISEKIGPYQRVGNKIWVGKTFYDSEGSVGVGDIGYFDQATQDWIFLHVSELADWSASALLVEPDTVWVGLIRNGEHAGISGGLLRYDRATHKASIIPIPDAIDKITRVGSRMYCGTSGGFIFIEQNRVHRFEFSPQLDGSYTVVPVVEGR